MLHSALCIAGLLALSGTPDAPVQPNRVLYFVHSAGYYHEIIPYSAYKMMEWAKENGGYEVDISKDCDLITPEFLARYDALVFYTNRELPLSPENRQAILDFVKQGKGLTAVHSGTGTFFEWEPYQEMINAIFDGHPWNQEINVVMENRKHPILKGVPKEFKIKDEIYQHKNWSRDVTQVLAHLDNDSVDVNAKGTNREDKDWALLWAHRYGKGRVYVNALGHTTEAWDNKHFQTMMVNGILWTLGELPLDLPEHAETGK